jgi:hypothetical protein
MPSWRTHRQHVPVQIIDGNKIKTPSPSHRYHYFDAVVGLTWSNDPKSYTGGSVATGRVSHARRVKGDNPDKKGCPSPPGWGLGVGQTTPPSNTYLLRNFNQSLGGGGGEDWRCQGQSWALAPKKKKKKRKKRKKKKTKSIKGWDLMKNLLLLQRQKDMKLILAGSQAYT